MAVVETDRAWWAVVLSLCTLVGFTIGIGLHDDSWDTISSMVARRELTLTAFAMATFLITVCQVYWLVSQVSRWQQHNVTAPPVVSTLLVVGMLMSIVGTLGFGVVSTKLLHDEHLRFAAVSFIGVLLYQLGIAWLSIFNTPDATSLGSSARGTITKWVQVGHASTHSPRLGVAFWSIAVASLIMLGLDEPFW